MNCLPKLGLYIALLRDGMERRGEDLVEDLKVTSKMVIDCVLLLGFFFPLL